MAVTPNSIVTPQAIKSANQVCDTAVTDVDDSPGAGVLTLLTAGSNGARLVGLRATPRATVTITQLQLYRSTNAGSTKRLIRSVQMPAYTFAATTAAPTTDFGFSEDSPLYLGAGDILYVGIGVALAAGVVFDAEYQEY